MELQHDPKTKQQIKDLLYEHLYNPVLATYRKRLKDIIVRNAIVQRGTHQSMIYRGEVYIAEDSITPPPRKLTQLHESLRDDMEDYLKETAYLNSHELPYVLGYINQVLNASDDIPDYLQLLPEAIHRPLQKVIETCGCRTTHLTKEEVEALKNKNMTSIELIKQRLTLNLLL